MRETDELVVKPHFTQKFHPSEFKPRKHLNPRREHQETIDHPGLVPNLHLNRIMNMKKGIQEQKTSISNGYLDFDKMN